MPTTAKGVATYVAADINRCVDRAAGIAVTELAELTKFPSTFAGQQLNLVYVIRLFGPGRWSERP
jgi:hypothetical protein